MIDLNEIINPFDNKYQIEFETYYSYVVSIGKTLEPIKQNPILFFEKVSSRRQFKAIHVKKDLDEARLTRVLHNSWFTEIQLGNLSNNPDFQAFSLQWAQVYTYYAVYLQLRGLILAKADSVQPNHRNTLNYFSNELNNRKTLFPTPLNMLCSGRHESPIFLNKSENFKNRHQLSTVSQDHPIDNVAKFLSTTRKKEVERRINEYKKQHKKERISAQAKKKIIDDLSATTVYDCLYRMRIKANYENMDAYYFAHVTKIKAANFHDSLNTIVWTNSLCLEFLIAKNISFKRYYGILDNFEKSLNKTHKNMGVSMPRSRFKLFETYIK